SHRSHTVRTDLSDLGVHQTQASGDPTFLESADPLGGNLCHGWRARDPWAGIGLQVAKREVEPVLPRRARRQLSFDIHAAGPLASIVPDERSLLFAAELDGRKRRLTPLCIAEEQRAVGDGYRR